MQIFYIHGFLSGPNAMKATMIRNYLKEHGRDDLVFESLSFPDTPREGVAAIFEHIDAWVKEHEGQPFAVIGSSLGGFYSSLVGIRWPCRAVLLNPCVHPQDYFVKLTGPQYNANTDCHFELTPDMLTFLKEQDETIKVNVPSVKVFLGTADEVLDYRRALEFYQGCDIRIVEGADHALTEGFEELIPEILGFIEG